MGRSILKRNIHSEGLKGEFDGSEITDATESG